MSRAAHLILEAKKAITDDQLQKFLDLARQEHWEEATKQLGVALASVSDLLEEGTKTLEALERPALQQPQKGSQETSVSNRGSHESSSGSGK